MSILHGKSHNKPFKKAYLSGDPLTNDIAALPNKVSPVSTHKRRGGFLSITYCGIESLVSVIEDDSIHLFPHHFDKL